MNALEDLEIIIKKHHKKLLETSRRCKLKEKTKALVEDCKALGYRVLENENFTVITGCSSGKAKSSIKIDKKMGTIFLTNTHWINDVKVDVDSLRVILFNNPQGERQ